MKSNVFPILLIILGSFVMGFGVDYNTFFAVVPGLAMIVLGAINLKPTTDSR